MTPPPPKLVASLFFGCEMPSNAVVCLHGFFRFQEVFVDGDGDANGEIDVDGILIDANAI